MQSCQRHLSCGWQLDLLHKQDYLKKDVSEIVTKNLGLFSIACVMYLVCGFVLMYPSDAVFAISGGLDDAGEAIVYGILPAIGTSWGLSTDMPQMKSVWHMVWTTHNKLTSFFRLFL